MATTSSSSSVVHIHNSRSAANGKAGGGAVAGKNLLQTANIQNTANAGASHSLDQRLFPSIPIDEENKSLCVSSCPTKSSSLISPKTLYGMCTGTGLGGAHFSVLPESENDSIIRRKLIRHFRFKSIDSQSNGHTRRQSAGATVHYNDAPISADEEDEHHAEHTPGMMDETTARRRVLAETMRQNYESLLGGTHVEEIMLALSINGDDAEKAFNWINESSLE